MRRHSTDPTIPTAQDAMLAESTRAALAAGRDLTTRQLPPFVTRLLMDILRETAAGRAVTLVPSEAEVTTQEAADILNVSRPFLVGLADSGVLNVRKVGTHRRLLLADVLAYKAHQFAEREKALDEMLSTDQELGLL